MIIAMICATTTSATMTVTSLNHWISPGMMHALGWALLNFLWQGTALAALAAAGMALWRRSSARYFIGLAALVLMLMAPLATFVIYAQPHSGVADAAKSSPLAAVAWPIARGNAAASGLTNAAPIAASRDALPWLVETWLIGVAFFSLRSAGGFFLLERERRRQSSVVNARLLEICSTLQDRLGIRRAIQYCECKWLQAPAVIGWFRPVVFLPVTALTGLSEEQLRSVIAHELAHIRRFDPFVNVFQVCVETLLFYHPAVWWLNKRIRAEREHCCDEIAVEVCGNAVEYARALTLMEEWRSAPVFAMAANRGPLTERIVRVLGLKKLGAGMRGIGFTGGVLGLTAALAAGSALLGLAHPHLVAAQSSFLWSAAASQAAPATAPRGATTPKPSAGQVANSNQSSQPASSYIEQMNAAGMNDLSIDDLIAMKIQGITPEYVREIHELGLRPNADELVGLKVQGITPEYVKEMRALGFNPDTDQLVGLKVQGVTPEYVHAMKEAGISADAEQIIGLKVQGVTPEYIRELRALGLKVDGDDVVGLKVQGVTPEYVKGLRDMGLDPSADEIVGMKVQGVTPDYIREIRALGFKPDADELVGMKVQGVTPEFIKALQSAGFKPEIDDIIGAKVQGVTPEFIEQVHKHGFKDLTIEKLIELKRLGILESKADL
jgi:beta-lactamase regulating signal transducer with metallopeptidase domain